MLKVMKYLYIRAKNSVYCLKMVLNAFSKVITHNDVHFLIVYVRLVRSACVLTVSLSLYVR